MKATWKMNQSRTLRQGSITNTNELGLIRRMPDMEGTFPMLLADLSDEIGALTSRTQSSLSIEVVQGSEQNLYSFRLQVGATLVCWLADPNDPEIHGMLQTWASAGHLFFGLKTNQGVTVQTRPVGGVPPSIDDITAASGGMDTGRFLRSTAAVVNSGLIKAQAQSDIASVPKIRKVRAFLVLGKNRNMGVRGARTS
jgi:hypothetical protein